jgi:hypothetical protein
MRAPEHDAGLAASERVKASRDRLNAAYQEEVAVSTQPCPLAGGPAVPPHAGRCSICQKEGPEGKVNHSIPRTDEAIAEAQRLLANIRAKGHLAVDPGDGGEDVTTDAFNDGGNMLGVLLCVDPNTCRTVILKAFSGTAGNTGQHAIDGYSPMLGFRDPGAARDAFDREDAAHEALLHATRDQQAASDDVEAGRDRLLVARGYHGGYAAFEDERRNVADDLAQAKGDEIATRATHKANRKKADRVVKTQDRLADLGEGDDREEIEGWLDEAVVAAEGITDESLAQDQAAAQEAADRRARIAARKKELDGLRKMKPSKDEPKDLLALMKTEKAATAEYVARKQEADEASRAAHAMKGQMQVHSFHDGEASRDLGSVVVDETGAAPDERGGTCGYCAAPKMLAEAKSQGLVPVSMAELWIGTNHSTQVEDGNPVESCKSCRSFIGAALCNLESKQFETLARCTPLPEEEGDL